MAIKRAKKKQDDIKIKSEDIILALTDYRQPFTLSSHLVVPNVSGGLAIHECDLLSVTKGNFATEIEIKVSVSDTKKDTLKKHGHKSNKIKYLYFAMPDYIYEKAKEFVPQHAGIYTVKAYMYRGKLRYKVELMRKAQVNSGHRKLTNKEYSQLERLMAMRYYTLLKKQVRESRRG